ncbi:MAG TPA: hypothetical protein VFZ25_10620 [Chloroflexota bacterium]|nr:hypothetical protein [Chloroflexota bacterium]
MRLLVLVFSAILAVSTFSLAFAEPAVTVNLTAQNNSGVSGTATLTAVGNQTQVVINVTGEPSGASEPAHIHVGACPNPGSVKAPLQNIVDGTSTTLVNAPLSSFTTGGFAINLHESATNISHFVSCGDIPAVVNSLPRSGGVPLFPILLVAGILMVSGYALRRVAA